MITSQSKDISEVPGLYSDKNIPTCYDFKDISNVTSAHTRTYTQKPTKHRNAWHIVWRASYVYKVMFAHSQQSSQYACRRYINICGDNSPYNPLRTWQFGMCYFQYSQQKLAHWAGFWDRNIERGEWRNNWSWSTVSSSKFSIACI